MNTNKIADKQVICRVLLERAAEDRNVVVLCSDSRGSSSMTPFAEAHPDRFVEAGIAEQNLVGMAAGLARCGKRPFVASPACFLSTRSYEQVKIDCAYSDTNVKLIGVSGGVSYGALGMSHHSAQDIAAMAALPNMRVYLPSDRFLTAKLTQALLRDESPAYVRVGRSAVQDVYPGDGMPFTMNRACVLAEGSDVLLVACGEMVRPALDAVALLAARGVSAGLLDMYCVKPLDRETLLRSAEKARCVVTVEEHSPFGGLGSLVSQAVGEACPRRVACLSLPDAPAVSGTSAEVFDYYGLNAAGIARRAMEMLK